MAAVIILLAVVSICATLLYAQRTYYSFRREYRTHVNTLRLGAELDKRLKEFDDLKAKVDGLAMRVGLGR